MFISRAVASGAGVCSDVSRVLLWLLFERLRATCQAFQLLVSGFAGFKGLRRADEPAPRLGASSAGSAALARTVCAKGDNREEPAQNGRSNADDRRLLKEGRHDGTVASRAWSQPAGDDCNGLAR